MEAVRQKSNHDQTQWQESPWTTQEKPAWFTFSPPSTKTYEKKNALSFIFPLPQKQIRREIRPQSKPERLRNTASRAAAASQRRPSFYKWASYYKYHWINKEFLFAMNKLSIVSMVVGLMFLGALFFISGFLLAVNLYILPSPTIPNLKIASAENPTHRASANAFEGTHRPTPPLMPPTTVPQQYATVGGVSMMPPSHKPTQSIAPAPVYSQPQPVYNSYNSVNPNSYPPQSAPGMNYPAPNYPTSNYAQPSASYGQAAPTGTTSPQYPPSPPAYVPSYPNASGPAAMTASPYH